MKAKHKRSKKYKIDWEWAKESTLDLLSQQQLEKAYGIHFDTCNVADDKTHAK